MNLTGQCMLAFAGDKMKIEPRAKTVRMSAFFWVCPVFRTEYQTSDLWLG